MKRISPAIPIGLVICLLLALSFFVGVVWAKPTTPDQAKKVVMNWLGKGARPLGARLGRQIKEVQTYYYGGAPAYYVVYLDPAGLVFLPADDLVEPIVGFLPTGFYDPSPTNPLGALVSRDIPGRVVKARKMEALAPEGPQAKARHKWDWLLASNSSLEGGLEAGLISISDEWVPSFVESRWGQTTDSGTSDGNACYNYFTPHNYHCGCGATAMAQLMRYWKFPVSPVVGTFDITIDGTQAVRSILGGDGQGGPYEWDMMVLDPKNSGADSNQRKAIGALTYDAGISAKTSYTELISTASDLIVANAFLKTFGYQSAKYGNNSDQNILETALNNMLNSNLNAQFPVILSILGSGGGHGVVCDGYGKNASTIYHHLNMGFVGAGDLWYNLPNIDLGNLNFNIIAGCIYNIYKSGSGEIIAGRVTDSNGNPLHDVTVTATTGGQTYPAMQKDDVAPTTVSGIYAIPKVPSATTFTVNASKAGYNFTSKSVTTGTSLTSPNTTGNRWEVDFIGYPKLLFSVGRWKFTNSMKSGRASHIAALLPNGKVLVAGGDGTTGILSTTETYDPDSEIWSTTGPLQKVRTYFTAALLHTGKVLIAGGWDGTRLASAELYDHDAGGWVATGSLKTGRSTPTGVLLDNGKFLISGGFNNGYLTSAELYDPRAGTWKVTEAMNVGRVGHTATLLPNRKILVVGGGGGSPVYLSSAELYDPINGTWSIISTMKTGRSSHTATLLPNGKVLVAGGCPNDTGSVLTSAELYDPVSGSWSDTGSMNIPRYGHTATLLANGKVLVAGGYNGSSLEVIVEIYDPANGTWSKVTSMNTGRTGHTATLLPNGKVLAVGGGNNGILASAELYNSPLSLSPALMLLLEE